MTINKKTTIYFFIVFSLVSAGLVYTSVAKKTLHLKNALAASASPEKITDAPGEIAPSASSEKSELNSNADPAEITELPKEAATDGGTIDAQTANAKTSSYPLHKNISTTYFWVGEEAGEDNKNISNLPSAWDEDWAKHFGCVDDPNKRNGFFPANAAPKENPFYFALPYNDFDENGNPKNDSQALAIWGQGKKFGSEQSMCKNQWIKIIKNGKAAYAQWEDVGPFGEDDKAYVFGGSTPKSKENNHAGLDVSPAVRDYLGLGDMDKTDWQFVDAKDVPDGPWKKIVTTSQVYWK